LAILKRLAAIVFRAPCAKSKASCAASASNLFGAETKGSAVMAAIRAAKARSKSRFALSPVPTAVPPWASR
jgi:hypothetical protein